MTNLDKAVPDANGMYKVEIQVNGEWVMLTHLTRSSILKLCDYADKLSDEDNV